MAAASQKREWRTDEAGAYDPPQREVRNSAKSHPDSPSAASPPRGGLERHTLLLPLFGVVKKIVLELSGRRSNATYFRRDRTANRPQLIAKRMNRNVYVVMGIAGSGKSTVGAALAESLAVDFVEGDDYHAIENVRRMASGFPLTDDDRAGWLSALAIRIREANDAGSGLVLTCSALKRSYRDILRAAAPELQLVFLTGPPALIAGRLARRRCHFVPASILESQLATLEEPAADEHAWVSDIRKSPQEIVTELVARASG